jgi:Tfp pilus assembly protein PilO
MKLSVKRRKTIVRSALVVILGLASWHLHQTPPVPVSELNRLELLAKSYRADNTRLENFRTELPADEKQWDTFFTTHFRPQGTGYSAISEDLGGLSSSAGLKTDGISFSEHKPDARGLMEIEISTAVEGNYESLIQFLNKLEHSENFYVLDSLTLASSTGGSLRLNLQLRTYFRT